MYTYGKRDFKNQHYWGSLLNFQSGCAEHSVLRIWWRRHFRNSARPSFRPEVTLRMRESVRPHCALVVLLSLFGRWGRREPQRAEPVLWGARAPAPLTLRRRRARTALTGFLVLPPPVMGKGVSRFTFIKPTGDIILLGDMTLLQI